MQTKNNTKVICIFLELLHFLKELNVKIAFCFVFFLGSSEAWPPTFCGCIFFVLHFFAFVFFVWQVVYFWIVGVFLLFFCIFSKFVYDFVEQAIQQLST